MESASTISTVPISGRATCQALNGYQPRGAGTRGTEQRDQRRAIFDSLFERLDGGERCGADSLAEIRDQLCTK